MTLRDESYWQDHYEAELKNFEENGDEGEIWFGKVLSRKIVERIKEEIQTENEDHTPEESVNILDVGCGNSYLLCQLVARFPDTKGIRCVGIDYSDNSIELSRKVVEARKLDEKIKLRQCNFLDSNQIKDLILSNSERKFDVIVDKGTFDAICLLASKSETELLKAKTSYMESVCYLANERALFVIASCNHTEEELSNLLKLPTKERRDTIIVGKIETPKFQFGGKEGSQVTCLVVKFSN